MKVQGPDQNAARLPRVVGPSATVPGNHPLLWLQRKAGNTAVSQLMAAAGGDAAAMRDGDRIGQPMTTPHQRHVDERGSVTGASRPTEIALQRSTAQPNITDLISFIPIIGSNSDRAAVELLAALGLRDENKITNLLFWAEHPTMVLQKIDPAQTELMRQWICIRNTTVRPTLRGAADKAKGGGKCKNDSAAPKVEAGTSLATTAATFIAENRAKWGLSKENECRSARFYSKGKRDELRAMDPANIAKYAKKYNAATTHFERSTELFRHSSLAEWKSGEDIAFIAAIATREGGAGIFRTDTEKVVSGGKDTHKKGASGLDNLGRAEYRKEFEDAGLSIKTVDANDPDLKAKNRTPAWIEAKDLLFAHMITTANHEKLFRTSYLASAAKKAKVEVDAESLWAGLSDPARRSWLGLFYSGVGHVASTLEALFDEQRTSGHAADLNDILSKDDFPSFNRVILARATALRAAAFEHLETK